MSHPMQQVRIHEIQHRAPSAKVKKLWVVRWNVDGRAHSKAFATSNEANRYRPLLVAVQHRLERFDRASGEPQSWRPRAAPTQVHVWCRRWIGEQWNEWQPRTRISAMEALARFVALAVADGAPPPPDGLRKHLVCTFPPGSEVDPLDECEAWLARWCLALEDLNRNRLGEVDRRLGIGDAGQVLSPSSASRFRKVARACVRRAVELDVLGADPWPPAPKGRSRRKAARVRRGVDVRRLPDPVTMVRVMAQAAARLRHPSQVVAAAWRLRLPDEGWGGARPVRRRRPVLGSPGSSKLVLADLLRLDVAARAPPDRARRMGHSVETLVSAYVGALTGDEQVANQRIDDTLAPALKPNLKVVS